jgi:hypothetical protein
MSSTNRIGNNHRNVSSDLFYNDQGGHHNFQDPQERFHSTATVTKSEQLKSSMKKAQEIAKRQITLEFRQDRESERWSRMAQGEKREDEKVCLYLSKNSWRDCKV